MDYCVELNWIKKRRLIIFFLVSNQFGLSIEGRLNVPGLRTFWNTVRMHDADDDLTRDSGLAIDTKNACA